jgi:hypothetical protein
MRVQQGPGQPLLSQPSQRKLRGGAVTDVTSASTFGAAAVGSYNMEGADVFFTELYRVVNRSSPCRRSLSVALLPVTTYA